MAVICRDEDADLRDSGLEVIVGNIDEERGAGVRESYVSGEEFPSFVSVPKPHQTGGGSRSQWVR